jgi:imidazolonepropionase-like amidohydrolase
MNYAVTLRALCVLGASAVASSAQAQNGFVIRAGTLIDGAGGMQRNLDVAIKIVMGTDAVAGAHGQNARETIFRVKEGGQNAMDAIIGTTSLAAQSMGLAGRIGAVKPAVLG